MTKREKQIEKVMLAIVQYDELALVAAKALRALENVPMVGEVYDQQHSDTHMAAMIDLRIALGLDPCVGQVHAGTLATG